MNTPKYKPTDSVLKKISKPSISETFASKTQKHRDILEQFRIIFLYFRLTFSCNFSIEGGIVFGKPVIKLSDLILNIIIAIYDIFLIYLVSHGFLFNSNIYLLNLGHQTVLILSVLTIISIHTIILLKRKMVWYNTQQMHYFDMEMEKLKYPIDSKKHLIYICYFFLIKITVMIILSLFKILIFYPDWYIILVEICLNIFLLVCTNLITTFTYFFVIRFRALNELLRKEKNLNLNNIKTSIKLYDKLNDTIDENNLCFFIILFLWVGICFLFWLFTMFSILVLWISYDEYTLKFVISESGTSIVSILLFSSILVLSNMLKNEVRK